jgi:hypothetical protein
MLTDFLISYHFLTIILQRSPKYFPLLPDFSNPLSFILIRVRSTFFCYRTSYHIITFRRSLRYLYCLQTPYLNRPVIPQGPKHSSLLSDFIVILSFRSVCQLCGWTVPSSGPRYLRWFFGRPSSSVRGTMCAMDRGQIVQSEVLYMPLDQCQSVRSEVLSMLSDVCQTVHSVGSFHLSFRLPFLLSFALSSALSSALSLSFLSYPFPQDLGKFFR